MKDGEISKEELATTLQALISSLSVKINSGFTEKLLMDEIAFEKTLYRMVEDKFIRTVANYKKTPFSKEDLIENLLTGFTSGYYMYFRKIFNDISLGRIKER